MSGLSYICEYSSDSETSDCEPCNKKLKLPVPDLSKVCVVPKDTHIDDPQLHGGRIRSFPHVRGHWASYVYIKYPDESNLQKLTDKLEEYICCQKQLQWKKCSDVHISLSKTFTLFYHMIAPFTSALQNIVNEEDSFELEFKGVQIYCNEDKTRTFIALEVDNFSKRNLLFLTEKIDGILKEFKLPTFYEEPSFHMSILWTSGDKQAEANNIKEDLDNIVSLELRETFKITLVKRVCCKSGNKYFQYYLK